MPAAQLVHTSALLVAEKVPALQLPQTRSVASVSAVTMRWPGLHVRADLQNVDVCEVWSWYVPAPHLVHARSLVAVGWA